MSKCDRCGEEANKLYRKCPCDLGPNEYICYACALAGKVAEWEEDS